MSLLAGGDYSRQDMSYACRLANRGFDARMIFRAISQKPSGRRDPGSIKYMRILDQRGRDAADRYARLTAEKAVAFVHHNPAIRGRPAALVRLLELGEVANSMPWCVYGGPGSRRALEGVFVVAERVGSVNFGLALREWAELTGIARRNIETHRDVLLRLGWLRRDPADRPGVTSRFGVRCPRDIHLTGRDECPASAGRKLMAHDAFRRGGLGDVGWYLLACLSRPMTPRELGDITGLGTAGVEDLAPLLERVGLLELTDALLLPTVDTSGLDFAAETFGTAGAGTADRAQHARERAERAAFLSRRDLNVRGMVP